MKNRGFTIAEALIVLAIIAIMSYLLFPLFMKVKSQLQIRSSINKLRVIHIAVENYRQAWDGADVFTSYRSYYKLGLPPHRNEKGVLMMPWYFFTDTTWKDWLSGCALSTDLDENAGYYSGPNWPHWFWGFVGAAGYIHYAAPMYHPRRIEGNEHYSLRNYLTTYRQNALIAMDAFCNPLKTIRTSMASPFVYKRGLSLLLSGQVINKYALGNATEFEWWSYPPED